MAKKPAADFDLVELKLRRARDPAKNYQPGPTQQRCLLSKTRYRWIGGGNRSGKTSHVAVELALAARRMHPTRSVHCQNGTYLVLAPSREQLQDPWEKKLLKDCELRGFKGQPLIPKWEIEKTHHTHGAGAPTIKQIDLKNGHCIKFAVSKDVESWKRIQGKAILGIFPDEAESNAELVKEWYSRLLDANSDPDICREAGGGWILWGATQTTANPALAQFVRQCDDPELNDWEAFRIPSEDNKAVSMEERERLMPALSDDDYKIRMLGTGSAADALSIYGKHFNPEKHIRASDYFTQPADNLWCGYDPGGAGKESHDTGIMFAALNQDEPNKLRIVHYIRLNRTTLQYDVKRISHWLRGRALEGFVYDPAIHRTEKGSGQSVKAMLYQALVLEGIIIRRGLVMPHNRHEAGIRRVQEYFERDLIELNPSKESGCQLVRYQIEGYRSYEEGVYQGVRGVVKKDDESVDCLRYIAMVRPRWVNRPCGSELWTGDAKPAPPVEHIQPLTPEQQNFQIQMQRSHRLASMLQTHRRIRN